MAVCFLCLGSLSPKSHDIPTLISDWHRSETPTSELISFEEFESALFNVDKVNDWEKIKWSYSEITNSFIDHLIESVDGANKNQRFTVKASD